MSKDPFSLRNLAHDASHEQTLLQLRSRLLGFLRAQRDPRAPRNGDAADKACSFDEPPFSLIMHKYTIPKGIAFLDKMRAGRRKWQKQHRSRL